MQAVAVKEEDRYQAERFRFRAARIKCAEDFPFEFTYPAAMDLAEDMLSWLSEQIRSAVLDPDSRVWFRYDPAEGKYSPVSGLAEKAARAFIMEAIESLGSRNDDRTLLLGLPVYGPVCPGEGHQASVGDIAQAMVDLSCSGKRADAVRQALELGRAPGLIYCPQIWHDGTWWGEDSGQWIGGDWSGEAIPLKSSGYAPAEYWLTSEYSGNPYPTGELATDAPTPGWDDLCAAIWPDPYWRVEALRGLSMGFTGRATKYTLYWRSETGRGKSLMAALVSDLLGDYGRTIPAKTLFGHSADPQRAGQELAGARLAIVEEGIGSESFRADEAFKAVTTGGGDINARALYQESRQERASHTILLCVNPEADMNYADPAILSRLVPIPFTGDPQAIRVLAERYNPGTAAWKAEAPVVLSRMITYAREFWAGTWRPTTFEDHITGGTVSRLDPELQAALEIKSSNDVGAWLDACRGFLSARTEGFPARDLYQAYARWSQAPVSETKWGRAVVVLDGVSRTRKGSGMVYMVIPPSITR